MINFAVIGLDFETRKERKWKKELRELLFIPSGFRLTMIEMVIFMFVFL
jgi:hypothetical protein